MPFTLAHPAIIIPLKRNYEHLFSTTGLIVGSIAPDIEGIYTLGLHRGISHTFLGIFIVDLPISIIISIIFHQIIKQPLLNYSFGYFKKRGMGHSTLNWQKYFLSHPFKVCLSILVGIALHIIWDLLTHSKGANAVGELCGYLGIFIQDISNWLQMVSTFVGLSVIMLYLHRLPVVTIEVKRYMLLYWVIVILIILSVMGLRYRLIFSPFDIFILLKTILCGLFTGVFCASLLFRST